MVQIDSSRADRASEDDPQRILRVMALRKQIREGSYQVNALALADRMLQCLNWP